MLRPDGEQQSDRVGVRAKYPLIVEDHIYCLKCRMGCGVIEEPPNGMSRIIDSDCEETRIPRRNYWGLRLVKCLHRIEFF